MRLIYSGPHMSVILPDGRVTARGDEFEASDDLAGTLASSADFSAPKPPKKSTKKGDDQ